jgi:hypothetical protein
MASLPKGMKRTVSQDNPELKINFEKLTGADLTKFPALRQSLVQDILDKIVERTKKKSIGWTGVKFPKYSTSYTKTDEFKAFGKTNKVNLTLTGGMLDLMDETSATKTTAVLGWDDDDEAAKAHGHITGSVGKTRDFFGVSKSEMDKILKENKRELDTAKELNESGKKPEASALEQRILQFITGLGGANG